MAFNLFQWFDPLNISSSYFHVPTQLETSSQRLKVTGRISSIVPFSKPYQHYLGQLLTRYLAYANRKFLVIGCPTGIFVSIRGHEGAFWSIFVTPILIRLFIRFQTSSTMSESKIYVSNRRNYSRQI